ncbi:MAG: N-formylglutamate amidohydrolase [Friedmanniella sp.]
MEREPSWRIYPGDPGSPVVLHVPHAATAVPADVRSTIVLDDDQLAAELVRMTDAHTDHLALAAAAAANPRPWVLANRLSRLVVDPERFPDDREEMAQVGMGAVYTRTSQGERLRTPDRSQEAHLLTSYFRPYAAAMTRLVAERLTACGRALILDIHSYPREPLPYELHDDLRRPPICLGRDAVHTPNHVLQAARAAFASFGEVLVDQPFLGTYVPSRFYRQEPRVQSLMLEIRRDVYLDEATGRLRRDRAQQIAAAISDLLATVDELPSRGED